MIFCLHLIFFSKLTFSKNSFGNTINVSNGLDQDQDRHSVGPDLGPNYLQRCALNTGRLRVKNGLYLDQWQIQRGFRRFTGTPLLAPFVFKYPMKMKQFGLSETKLFHFHGIFRKNEINSKRTPTP